MASSIRRLSWAVALIPLFVLSWYRQIFLESWSERLLYRSSGSRNEINEENVNMIAMSIYKVGASPWEIDTEGKTLSRDIVLQTTFGERREHISITRSDGPDCKKAMGILIATNFKVLEPSGPINVPDDGAWLAAVLKHGDQNLDRFVCQCRNIDQGSILSITEPEDMSTLMSAMLSGLGLTIELHGEEGVVDSVYLPGDDDFPKVFSVFWTRAAGSILKRKKWFGLF